MGICMPTELTLSFEDVSLAEASEYAADLRQHLTTVAPGVQATARRADPNAQDMGATLALVLGAPAVVVLAKGLATWLRMRQESKAKVIIRDAAGNVLVEIVNVRSADVRALLEGKLGDAVGR